MKNSDQPILMADGSIYHEPLTKREYFAGLAMQGLMKEFKHDGHELKHCENVARKAVRMADSLLKQLEK
jgi:hypothetical protein